VNKHAKINNKEIQLKGHLSLEGVLKSPRFKKNLQNPLGAHQCCCRETKQRCYISTQNWTPFLPSSLFILVGKQKKKMEIIITELGLGLYPMTQTRESEQQQRRRRTTTTTTGVLYPLSDADGCDAAPARRFLSSVAFVSSVVGCPIHARQNKIFSKQMRFSMSCCNKLGMFCISVFFCYLPLGRLRIYFTIFFCAYFLASFLYPKCHVYISKRNTSAQVEHFFLLEPARLIPQKKWVLVQGQLQHMFAE